MNQLTPEQLDMIKRLQPLFREKMGKWQVGDEIQYGHFPAVVVQVKESDDLVYARFDDSSNFLSADRITFANENWLRIPKPIDWQNPERGCLGMLNDEAFPSLFQCYDGQWHIAVNSGTQEIIHIAPDPFTALLKALCEQEGV